MFQSPLLLEASTFPPFPSLWFNKMDVYFPAKSHRKPRATAGHGTARSILLVKYSCKPLNSTRNLQNNQLGNQRDSPHIPPRPLSFPSLKTGSKGFHTCRKSWQWVIQVGNEKVIFHLWTRGSTLQQCPQEGKWAMPKAVCRLGCPGTSPCGV